MKDIKPYFVTSLVWIWAILTVGIAYFGYQTGSAHGERKGIDETRQTIQAVQAAH